MSPKMVTLRAALRNAAPLPFPVLLVGETGSGKELCAQSLHALSKEASRRAGRLLSVNAALLAEDRMGDSELFGHKKSAFTGADRDRDGRIKEAHGGTLFLDELDSLPAGMQARLLRALGRINESRITFTPLGGSEADEATCDVRLVTAIHHDDGPDFTLRADLYHRVSTITIRIPPLRERGEDILLLAEEELRRLEVQLGAREPYAIEKDAKTRLLSYLWPGNVRELQRLMIQGVIAARIRGDHVIRLEDLQVHMIRRSHRFDSDSTLEQQVARFRVAAAEYALARNPGNKTAAARELGYANGQLLERKLEKWRKNLNSTEPAGDE